VETRDVLAEDVQVGRPPLRKARLVGAIADRRRVVDQRIEPDVDHLLGCERQGNAPRLPRPAHRDVLETAVEQAQDLVAADLWLEELRMVREMPQQPVAILGEAEEVVLLPDPLRRHRRVQRTLAVDEIFLRLERLA
jgi:hypothetical protein